MCVEEAFRRRVNGPTPLEGMRESRLCATRHGRRPLSCDPGRSRCFPSPAAPGVPRPKGGYAGPQTPNCGRDRHGSCPLFAGSLIPPCRRALRDSGHSIQVFRGESKKTRVDSLLLWPGSTPSQMPPQSIAKHPRHRKLPVPLVARSNVCSRRASCNFVRDTGAGEACAPAIIAAPPRL